MRNRTRAALNPIAVFAVVVVVVAALLAVGGKFVFESVAKRAEQRKAEKQSTNQLLDDAQKLVGGGQVAEGKQFPNTPVGRMNRSVYDLMLGEQERQRELNAGLKGIGWDWVMTAESLKNKANVEESLRRLEKARGLVKAYHADLDRDWNQLIRTFEQEAKAGGDARDYYKGFKENADKPGNGLYFARRIMVDLKRNHDALEKALKFLLNHAGRYQAQPDGQILFNADVPDRDIDLYNQIIEDVNSAMKAIEETERLRLKVAQDKIASAREGLR